MATKRKPTPAQIAARERFAEMARSGAFKKKAAKAKKAKAAPKRNPRASNPVASKRKANPVKRVALPYVVEAKRDIGGETVNMGAIAAFPGRAQADDYAKALQSRHKGLKLTVKAK